MDSSDCDAGKLSPLYERILILADLVSLGNVGIEIILPIKLRIRSNLASDGNTYFQHMVDCRFIDDGECSGMSHAHGTDMHVRFTCMRIIFRAAKHLRFGLKLG